MQAKDLNFTQEISVPVRPEAVWDALTQPDRVKDYHLAPLLRIELKAGGEIVYGTGDEVLISGTIIEYLENSSLAHTFRFGAWSQPGTSNDADTVVRYEIRREGGSTVLKLIHAGFKEANQTYANIVGGWPVILRHLKAFLERKE